ncbi:hypothetical protein GCM10020221_12170 [Streptomyces thioluteus]|uniref:Uncharacterized protein n=1 Tax=Streptomyces thioluteus TaxID=66431 RepID=A0ABP6J268_STRTU
MTTTGRPARAVVIGGSMAGLLAARALTDTYEEVLMVDRDVLPATLDHRVGVPQARHAHWLLAGGLEVLESFFPGLSAELAAAGATPYDPQRDGSWVFDGRPAQRAPSGLACLAMSRTLLESRLRARIAALPGVRVLSRHEVVGLLTAPDGCGIGGVRAVRRGRPEPALEMRADLVVDASGRASRTPLWLRELGHRAPREERVRVKVAYASRHYRRESHHVPGTSAIGRHVTPDRSRGAALYAEEGDRWVLTLAGVLSGEPPVSADAFMMFGRSLDDSRIRQVVMDAEPLDDPVRTRFPEALRRRYERLPRPPEGLVVIGDAMCSTNPTLAHGMSVAAFQAKALHDCLRAGTERLPRRYHRRAARVLTVPWIATRTSDVLPYESGCRRSVFLWSADLARIVLSAAMERDALVTRTCLRIAHLVTGLWPLLSPRILIRVLPHLIRLLPHLIPGGARTARSPGPDRMPWYLRLVELCRELGIATPEDPYPVWEGEGGPVAVAPLFVLYDYSFRVPGADTKEESLRRAYESGVVCTDEHFLHPDPYPTREDWCRARVEYTERRLAELGPELRPVLINHWPLLRDPTRILRYPDFAQWCGTTLTADWHVRFRAAAAVYGHLHIPRVSWHDGVRFEEVSVGYPREWRKRPPREPLRQILPQPVDRPGDVW